MKTLRLTVGIALATASMLAMVAEPAARADDAENFVSLFDGKSLDNWDGDSRFWSVDDGTIVGQTTAETPTKSNTFLIWKGGEPADFELKFQYRIDSDWANSGIQVRSRRMDGYRVAGYQPDLATDGWIPGILYEEGGRGVLARRGQKVVIGPDGQKKTERFAEENALLEHLRSGDWNDYHVVARGNSIVTTINGVKTHELIDDAPQARASGIIAFQLHAGPPMKIRFRDIQLKTIK